MQQSSLSSIENSRSKFREFVIIHYKGAVGYKGQNEQIGEIYVLQKKFYFFQI